MLFFCCIAVFLEVKPECHVVMAYVVRSSWVLTRISHRERGGRLKGLSYCRLFCVFSFHFISLSFGSVCPFLPTVGRDRIHISFGLSLFFVYISLFLIFPRVFGFFRGCLLLSHHLYAFFPRDLNSRIRAFKVTATKMTKLYLEL